MKSLRLPLKRKWFELTESGIKTEDYREITPYWCSRLTSENLRFWKSHFEWFQETFKNEKGLWLDKLIEHTQFDFKPFNQNTMTLGYPKNTDTERIINFEHKGIEIGYGKEEWGAEPNKLYFIIKHGKQINALNK